MIAISLMDASLRRRVPQPSSVGALASIQKQGDSATACGFVYGNQHRAGTRCARRLWLFIAASCLAHVLLLTFNRIHHPDRFFKTRTGPALSVRLTSPVSDGKSLQSMVKATSRPTTRRPLSRPTTNLLAPEKQEATPAEKPAETTPPTASAEAAVTGIHLPRIMSGLRGYDSQASPSPDASNAYYQQMMAMQAQQVRAMQLQHLGVRINQLASEWGPLPENMEGKCRISKEGGDALGCEPIALRQALGEREGEIVAILNSMRSLGAPADGLFIVYREARYTVSLLDENVVGN